jgi:hypothetical protein
MAVDNFQVTKGLKRSHESPLVPTKGLIGCIRAFTGDL